MSQSTTIQSDEFQNGYKQAIADFVRSMKYQHFDDWLLSETTQRHGLFHESDPKYVSDEQLVQSIFDMIAKVDKDEMLG